MSATLVIASRNGHKIEEIRAVLGDRFRYLTLQDLPGAPTPEETGRTFADNARIKAEALADWWLAHPTAILHPNAEPAWVLADDSGLEVDALGGAPGVTSARFASTDLGLTGNAPDHANNARLLLLLKGVPTDRRTGRFRCVLALVEARPGLPIRFFEGTCEGDLGHEPRGAAGFGYDPLFTPTGSQATFAELGAELKNKISHRARALTALREWLAADSSLLPR